MVYEQKPSRKNRISVEIFLVGMMLILLSLACNLPVMANQSVENQLPEDYVETSIAKTMDALENLAPSQDIPPTATFTPENTETPSQTPTITDTPTPEVPVVYVSSNTNCRTGPAKVYDWLITVQQGEESEIIAKDPTGGYWYIRKPGQENAYCWLWGKYATPIGDTDSLPVYTPMPTPTPSFPYTVSFSKLLGPCGGLYATMYVIDNVGTHTLESWKTSATDHTGGANPIPSDQDAFYEYNAACAQVNAQVDLTPGESYYLVMVFGANPHGHDISTKIKICTADGLGGECFTQTFRHTP